jgi:hypothetical protein
MPDSAAWFLDLILPEYLQDLVTFDDFFSGEKKPGFKKNQKIKSKWSACLNLAEILLGI